MPTRIIPVRQLHHQAAPMAEPNRQPATARRSSTHALIHAVRALGDRLGQAAYGAATLGVLAWYCTQTDAGQGAVAPLVPVAREALHELGAALIGL
ncbi:hypothetical protein [Azospirillum sp. sgz302134]